MKKRQIILDTETTGLDPASGHRIIEIGCVELVNRRLTGQTFHTYINPERAIDPGAERVHGISSKFLKDKPRFKEIHQAFLDFISDDELVIHNAVFDLGFLNHELRIINPKQPLIESISKVTDTLILARAKHPGQKNNLDALCKRYSVDNSNRQLHGALKDAEILALVYLAMTTGQEALFVDVDEQMEQPVNSNQQQETQQTINEIRTPIALIEQQDLVAHQEYLEFLRKKSGAIIEEW